MQFNFRTGFAVAGSDLYRFGVLDGGAAPEPEPDPASSAAVRSPMRASAGLRGVMRSPFVPTRAPGGV